MARIIIEELDSLFYSSSNNIKVIKSGRLGLVGHVPHMGEINSYKILFRKPQGKRPLWKPTYRWKHKVKSDSKRLGVNWIKLIEYTVKWQAILNTMNLWVP
jgi:hypothetical protein